jgi:hypothetical protein
MLHMLQWLYTSTQAVKLFSMSLVKSLNGLDQDLNIRVTLSPHISLLSFHFSIISKTILYAARPGRYCRKKHSFFFFFTIRATVSAVLVFNSLSYSSHVIHYRDSYLYGTASEMQNCLCHEISISVGNFK